MLRQKIIYGATMNDFRLEIESHVFRGWVINTDSHTQGNQFFTVFAEFVGSIDSMLTEEMKELITADWEGDDVPLQIKFFDYNLQEISEKEQHLRHELFNPYYPGGFKIVEDRVLWEPEFSGPMQKPEVMDKIIAKQHEEIDAARRMLRASRGWLFNSATNRVIAPLF